MVFDDEWRIAYLNEAAKALAAPLLDRIASAPEEIGVEDLVGRHLWTTFPTLAESAFRPVYEEAARDGKPRHLVERFEQVDRWYEAQAVPRNGNLVVIYRDVTEREQAESDMREFIDGIAEAERIVHFGVWRWDVGSGRVRWSDELHHIYGLRPGEFEGTVDAFLAQIHPDDRERIQATILESVEGRGPFAFEERILRPDGSERTLLSQGRVLEGADGEVEALVGVCHDITERARAERALGASEMRMRAIVDNSPSLIVVKDLEGRILMTNTEAQRVSGVDAESSIGRRSEEILPAEVAAAEREIEQRAASEGEPVYGEVVTAVGGEPRSYVTVTFPLRDESGTPAELCTIATDVTERRERESERRERLKLTEEIASALDENRMMAYAQPIVDLSTDTLHASELLVRMRSAHNGARVLGPDAFLPAAERFELVPAIDTWMVRQAVDLPSDARLHVNISAVTMVDPVARAKISELLGENPGAASRIVFEITETASVERLDAAKAFAAEVVELGASLALDDFGVGFGAFQYLRSLPFSQIKIDTSFVRGVVTSPQDRQVVKAVVGIAREFGLQTVAEGIESEAILEHVRELGADFGQGHVLGRPSALLPGVLLD